MPCARGAASAIACKPGKGGDLLTKEEFENGIIRVEFKLPKAGNNGIALRTPLGGHSASDGLELQVIDSDGYNEKQAAAGKPGLKPEQYHGSLYHCVGAKHGYLRPVGEWNFQEIEIQGQKIKVTLNGTKILDVDISRADLLALYEDKPTEQALIRAVKQERRALSIATGGAEFLAFVESCRGGIGEDVQFYRLRPDINGKLWKVIVKGNNRCAALRIVNADAWAEAIALAAVAGFWVLLFRTYAGFQLQVGGLAPAAAGAGTGAAVPSGTVGTRTARGALSTGMRQESAVQAR